MKIGLTYDLRREYLEMGFSEEETAEFDSDETIYSLEETISGLGYDVARIGNVYELTKRLVNGERWDLIFNICEGLCGRSREAQVPALLEAYNIPYTFGDPLTLSLSLDKAMAKRIVRDAGVPTPEFFSITSAKDLEEKNLSKDINFPLFVKPTSEGTSKGVSTESIVWDKDGLKKQCMKVLIKYRQPVLVEKYLPGREFTAGILGTDENARVIGVLEVKLRENTELPVYSFVNKEFCEELVRYTLVRDKNIVKEATTISLMAYRTLGCRDAGRVDLRADNDGRLYFLEINPLAGLHPTHSDLPIICSKAGITYTELISEIIKSALEQKGKSLHYLSLI
jgi:D-alanine-D-alanine ligase